VLLFNGDDPEALEMARARWSEASAVGAEVTYWKTNEDGRWERQAEA
jgi:DNA polymerase-3 subunit chi